MADGIRASLSINCIDAHLPDNLIGVNPGMTLFVASTYIVLYMYISAHSIKFNFVFGALILWNNVYIIVEIGVVDWQRLTKLALDSIVTSIALDHLQLRAQDKDRVPRGQLLLIPLELRCWCL